MWAQYDDVRHTAAIAVLAMAAVAMTGTQSFGAIITNIGPKGIEGEVGYAMTVELYCAVEQNVTVPVMGTVWILVDNAVLSSLEFRLRVVIG